MRHDTRAALEQFKARNERAMRAAHWEGFFAGILFALLVLWVLP